MPIIKQKIKGKNVISLDVEATEADLTELGALLEGEVTTFDKKSEGGTATALPTDLNAKKFSCGNRALSFSCSVSVPHMKPTVFVGSPEFDAVVVGAFDANYETTAKAEYSNLLYDRN